MTTYVNFMTAITLHY